MTVGAVTVGGGAETAGGGAETRPAEGVGGIIIDGIIAEGSGDDMAIKIGQPSDIVSSWSCC